VPSFGFDRKTFYDKRLFFSALPEGKAPKLPNWQLVAGPR
jgi:hypothetical protein